MQCIVITTGIGTGVLHKISVCGSNDYTPFVSIWFCFFFCPSTEFWNSSSSTMNGCYRLHDEGICVWFVAEAQTSPF